MLGDPINRGDDSGAEILQAPSSDAFRMTALFFGWEQLVKNEEADLKGAATRSKPLAGLGHGICVFLFRGFEFEHAVDLLP